MMKLFGLQETGFWSRRIGWTSALIIAVFGVNSVGAAQPLEELRRADLPGRDPQYVERAEEIVNGRPAAANEVIVRYRANASPANKRYVEYMANAKAVNASGASGSRIVLIQSKSKNVTELITELSAQPGVLYAEPNYRVSAIATPNDGRFTELWGMNNNGQTIGGQTGAPDSDIDAVEAWNTTTGSTEFVVGVVDTGVDYNHPDLAANVWSAPRSFTVNIGGQSLTCPAGSHGLRSIGGGNLSCDPMDDNTSTICFNDICSFGKHGTHVSGTIGARGDNARGVAGVNWNTQIIGLKFLDFTGGGFISDAINAVEFAIQVKQQGLANIRVLNNSWGGGGVSQAMIDVINKANDNDILFVSAAGNSNTDNDVVPVIPGSINAANSLNVAATDNLDAKAGFSSFGATTVHLGAPGVDILSTVGNGGNDYWSYSGTSMASPHVSGAAALVLAACPGLNAAGLKNVIMNSVDPVSSMAGITITGGRLNVNNAINACSGPFYVSPSPSIRNVRRNVTTTYAISVGSNSGFSNPIDLSVSGVPNGTTASISPARVTAGSTATLTVRTSSTTPFGTHTMTVDGVSGSTTSGTTVTLQLDTPDFSIAAVPPASAQVAPGESATYTVDLGSVGGFASTVNLSVAGGLPSGATARFSPASVAGGSGTSTLTVNTSSATPDGSYTLNIRGVGGGKTHNTSVALDVRTPAFTMRVSPEVRTHERTTYTSGYSNLVFVTPQNGFSGDVTVTVSGLPSGAMSAFPATRTIRQGQTWPAFFSSYNRIPRTTALGTYTVTYTATGGGVSQSVTQQLTIVDNR